MYIIDDSKEPAKSPTIYLAKASVQLQALISSRTFMGKCNTPEKLKLKILTNRLRFVLLMNGDETHP